MRERIVTKGTGRFGDRKIILRPPRSLDFRITSSTITILPATMATLPFVSYACSLN